MTKIENEGLKLQTQEAPEGAKASRLSKAKQHNLIAKASKRARVSKKATDKPVTETAI